jgi:hypothetical protein
VPGAKKNHAVWTYFMKSCLVFIVTRANYEFNKTQYNGIYHAEIRQAVILLPLSPLKPGVFTGLFMWV